MSQNSNIRLSVKVIQLTILYKCNIFDCLRNDRFCHVTQIRPVLAKYYAYHVNRFRVYVCAGMDTRFTEDYAQYESKQHLSNSLFEKAVSGDF